MAVVPVFVGFGNSNWDGIAPLSGVPTADFLRWTSSALPASTFPFSAPAPGVRVFTPRLPFATTASREITGSAANTVTMASAVAGTAVDQWVYISAGSAGEGQHRQITVVGGAVLTVTPNWGTIPSVSAASQVQVLARSCTMAAMAANPTRLIKTATATAFSAADVGKWVAILSGTSAGQVRKITAFVSATTVDVEVAVTGLVAGDGVCVLDGANVVDTLANLTSANSTLQDFRFYYDFANFYATGVDYPNLKSAPLSSPSAHKAAQYVNVLPELSWQLRSKFDQKIHVISLGASASTITPLYSGASLSATQFSWAHDITSLDFHPASPNGLYQTLTQSIRAGCELIVAEGNTPDIIGIAGIIAENDAAESVRASAYKESLRTFRDNLRRFIADNGFTLRKPHLIPFLVTNLKSSVQPFATVTNQASTDLATEDSRTAVIDTSDATYTSGLHFDAPFFITLGKRFFAAWQTIFDRDNYGKRTLADLPMLATIRTRIRRRYERGTTGNDTSNQQIDAFLNDSLREIGNTLGDSAWFLRRAEVATSVTSALYPNTIALEANIARILRIETAIDPGRALVWKGISYTSNLRVQITLHDCSTGPFIVHFIQLQPDLVDDSDIAILPGQYIELLVALTCKRLAECGGNASMASYYGVETERLWRYVKRDCLRYDRMRQESMSTSDAYDTLRNGTSSDWLWSL